MRIALLFPGQSSQAVGMGADFRRLSPRAAAIFAAADAHAGLLITDACLAGPLERLTETRYAQPAIVATSLAALACLLERVELPIAACAGHSVGEVAALAAAGALSVEDALELVSWRAALMAEAGRAVEGGMAAVLGLDENTLAAVCAAATSPADGTVEIANLNSPDQIVIAGSAQALARAADLARARGARRVIPLNVSAPFHSRYMRPAAERFATVIERVPIREATVPVVLNVDAQLTCDPARIRAELAVQIAAPVRWCDSVRRLGELGVDTFLELGHGSALSGLVRRTLPGATCLAIQDERSLAEAVARLRGSASAGAMV